MPPGCRRRVRGEGVWLYDAHGRRYLDAYNNVPIVGHCHPRVVEAITRQANALNVHTRYLHENIVRYAERLTATFDGLDMAVFTCERRHRVLGRGAPLFYDEPLHMGAANRSWSRRTRSCFSH
jgi:hypothetical protein